MKTAAKYSPLKKIEALIYRIKRKIYFNLKMIGFEGFVWSAALVYLAFFFNPAESHFTICPLSNFGVDDCPGCGLGRSISLLFSGKITESFQTHILGIPAVLILILRIFSIMRTNYSIHKKLNSKERNQYA
ncbi:MAG: DUF2752 domain-containing protein [Ignavibacterium sp.]|nr:DUF2752 domain-containing protein [Ignavibacterium sp.]